MAYFRSVFRPSQVQRDDFQNFQNPGVAFSALAIMSTKPQPGNMKQASLKLQELMMKRSDSLRDSDESFNWDAAFIADGLYVGSLRATQSAEGLRDHNIVAVLTVAGRLTVELPEDINHLSIDIPDHPGADILGTLAAAVPFIDNVIAASPSSTQQAVLVHCASGISRSVSVCCAWLMLRKSLTFEDALEMVRVNRPLASPNLGFHAQLTILSSVLQSITGDGAVEAARTEYKSKLGTGTLMDALFAQRTEANEIHGAVDELEDSIKQAGDLSLCPPAQVDAWRAQLQTQLRALQAIEGGTTGSVVTNNEESGTASVELPASLSAPLIVPLILDKPAAMVRRAALSKIERLLDDLG